MNKKESDSLFKKIKTNRIAYIEELHCPMVLLIFSKSTGSVAKFCTEATISDNTFYGWVARHDLFSECYRIGAMMGRCEWEREGEDGHHDEDFNMDYWRIQGSIRFGLGKTNRTRVDVDAESNPYDQYKQLMKQASHGDFTAGELKQLMEAVNVGRTVFETFKLQAEVDKMKDDILKMSQNSGNNIIPIEKASKTN